MTSDPTSAFGLERPSSIPCVVELVPREEDRCILALRGGLNETCEEELSRAFEEGFRSKQIVLDFSGLGHIHPEGAGLLVINATRAARRGVSLAAWGGMANGLRDVFRLTRIDEVIDFRKTDSAAGKESSSGQEVSRGYSPMPGWAKAVDRVRPGKFPPEAMNVNVNGRRNTSPVNGFGALWDKKYRLVVTGLDLDPRRIISTWKSEFPDFWPPGNRVFFSGEAGRLETGAVGLLNLKLPGGMILAAGMRVIYEDDESFTFMSLQGHVICGWITFRAWWEEGATVIQVHPTFRNSDPLMELGFRLGGAKQEDWFWRQTLCNLGRRLGIQGRLEQQNFLVDPRLQWNRAGNVWYNAVIRSLFRLPLFRLRRLFGKGRPAPIRV